MPPAPKSDQKIGLFERPQAATIDDLDNKIAFQHIAFRTSAEQLLEAQVELQNLKIEYEGPEDTGVAYSMFLNDPDEAFRRAGLDEQERDLVSRRDWLGLVRYGVNFFVLEKFADLRC